jgi:hypothetical protein
MAGIPPDTPYVWKSSIEGGYSVKYFWGNMTVDENTLPRKIHVRSSPPVDASFTQKGRIITLMMDRGSDKLELSMVVIEGGRWLKGILGSEQGGS